MVPFNLSLIILYQIWFIYITYKSPYNILIFFIYILLSKTHNWFNIFIYLLNYRDFILTFSVNLGPAGVSSLRNQCFKNPSAASLPSSFSIINGVERMTITLKLQNKHSPNHPILIPFLTIIWTKTLSALTLFSLCFLVQYFFYYYYYYYYHNCWHFNRRLF